MTTRQSKAAAAHAAMPEAASWLTPGRFAILLAGLILVCFPGVVLGWETFFFRDFALFGYPLAFYQRECFWRGELPLWNPYNNSGIPFLAQWNTMTLYPPSLFYLILPLSWSLGVFCLLHMFLGGMGMYFLAHRWTGNRLAAAVAGITFAFNGLTWNALMWPNNIAALGWMPWVVLAGERAWREGGRRRIALAALAGALQLLAGAPEVIILTWCVVGLLWADALIRGEIPRRRLAGRFSGVVTLTGALAAGQLLPFLDLLAHSQRDTSFGGSAWAMPVCGWANYLVPLFHLHPSAILYGVFVPEEMGWTNSYYLGVGTLALALLAVWQARQRRVWLLAILGGFGLIMAMGEKGWVYGWLKRALPVLGFMRFPVKFVVLPTFLLPCLAAFAVAWWQQLPSGAKAAAGRRRVLMLGALLLGLMGAIVWYDMKFPAQFEDATITAKNAAVRAGFLVAILGCLWALGGRRETKLRWMLQAVLLALCWFDIYTHAPSLNPTVSREVYEPDVIRQFFKWDTQPRAGDARAMPTQTAVTRMNSSATGKPEADVFGERLALNTDCNLLDHVPKVDGFYSLYLHQESEISFGLYMTTNALTPLKDFMGVCFISNPTNTVDWIRRDSFMPLVTIGQEPRPVDDLGALRGVLDEGFDPRRVVYLPSAAGSEIKVTAVPGARVISRAFAAQRIDLAVESPAATMLVVAQAFYHPWHAYVDDRRVRVWPANVAFQALEVPAGRHQVRLVYEDYWFWCGAGISLLALSGCVLMWLPRKRPV